MNEIKNGVVYCDPPIKCDIFEFLLSHLDCDCAFKKQNMSNPVVEIVAYSSALDFNNTLRDEFENVSDISIMTGIGKEEVNSID